jgi:type IV pilus biogenesis protein CpaD/CtpE
MQIHPCLLSVTVALTLAACAPPAADFTESEWPKQLTLDDATTQLDIRFLPGSSRLAAADAARLRVLAANGSIAPADRVLVAAAGSPDLAAARVGAIANYSDTVLSPPRCHGGLSRLTGPRSRSCVTW